MKPNEQTLWNKLSAFSLDESNVVFCFSDRLARENGWTYPYTLRVIEEYKKFLFLCCISSHSITPSDAVDQAWHLHLTYTKSYWTDLCKNTIGKEIHHNPTKGGKDEADKFDGFYTSTHDLYKEVFGCMPPTDIWPDNNTRFSDIDFRRVNLKKHWLIKKPTSPSANIIIPLILCCIAIMFIQASPAIPVLVTALFFIILIVRAIRQEKKENPRRNRETESGCATSSGCSGCNSYDSHHSSHHNDSGSCSADSGCSNGCSASGCSGCGSSGD